MSDQEFWRLTLKQYNALVKRHNFKYEQDQARMAVDMAILYAVQQKSKSRVKWKPFEPADFLKDSEKDQIDLKNRMIAHFKWMKMMSQAKKLNQNKE